MDATDMLMRIMAILLQGGILAVTGRALLPFVVRFMKEHGLSDRNFRGESIPTACGLLLWLLLLEETLLVAAMKSPGQTVVPVSGQHDALFMSYSLSLSSVALLGFMDDAVGLKQVKGIAGHWRLWKERKQVSTGLLKAAGTAAAAAVFALQQDNVTLLQRGSQMLLLMLMTNGMNLLDLRPGRALKSFFTMGALWLIAAVWIYPLERVQVEDGYTLALQTAPFVLPVLIGAWVLFNSDLKGKLMLGDTGANMLGFASGCWLILTTGWLYQSAVLFLMVLLHIVTWRCSLSRLIERNRLLHWLDLLGRRGSI
jgi:UDP-N-acetylmuramyl pentapeptide phosphotransferase/UDP-N-acetylglucosamine-1-phosphate transferase